MWQMSGPGAHARPARPFRALRAGENPRTRSSATAMRRRGFYQRARYASSARPALTSPGDYSIADIACFPWTMTHKAQGFTLDDYPNVKRWYAGRPRAAAGAGGACDRQIREGAVRRGGAKESCSGRRRRRWREEAIADPSLRGAKRRAIHSPALIVERWFRFAPAHANDADDKPDNNEETPS